jgi:hypothetical protein
MKLTSPIEKAIAGFYNLFTIGEWQTARTIDLAKTIDVRSSDINFARRLLIEQGSLEYTLDRDPRKGVAHASYRLVDTAEVAAKKIGDNPTPSISHWRADHGEESLYRRGVLKPWKKDETVWVAEDPKPEPVKIETKPVTLTRSLPELAPLRKSEP